MRFNLPARLNEFARIAALLGEDVPGLSEEAAAERAMTAVERLRADIGIPERLRDIGVKRGAVAGRSRRRRSPSSASCASTRARSTVADLEGIYQAAW